MTGWSSKTTGPHITKIALLILSSHWKQNFWGAKEELTQAFHSSACKLAVNSHYFLGSFWPSNPTIEWFLAYWKVAPLYNGISQWLSGAGEEDMVWKVLHLAELMGREIQQLLLAPWPWPHLVHTSFHDANQLFKSLTLTHDLMGGDNNLHAVYMHDSLSVCCSRGTILGSNH